MSVQTEEAYILLLNSLYLQDDFLQKIKTVETAKTYLFCFNVKNVRVQSHAGGGLIKPNLLMTGELDSTTSYICHY